MLSTGCKMQFNENSRVKIPTILHLMSLGYKYLSLKDHKPDSKTNIFNDIFIQAIKKLNPQQHDADINRLLEDIKSDLNNEDLGKAFYQRLISSPIKLIDFENFTNNSLHVVTELSYKNDDEEFRPDITLLINGLPLVFIEVKTPNNSGGIQVERDRMNTRLANKKNLRFINITQLMIFSNNMEYDDNDSRSRKLTQGAFYATTAKNNIIFNYFREQKQLTITAPKVTEQQINEVLLDNNATVIKHSPEFATNQNPNTPTNRICTSLLSPERLAFILRYAFAYVRDANGMQKHIMRYPQLFATQALAENLNKNIQQGIVWHTQGSGKTALAFYNVRFLTDFYQQQGIIAKFYFIVDRIDLLEQAKKEFSSRGLVVNIVASKDEFAEHIKENKAIHNDSGKLEITVVNIHKFKDDPDIIKLQDYHLKLQRVYFLDEVHRSYNPKGSFLANLYQSDPKAIKIGLSGTPLIVDSNNTNKNKYASKQIIGGYFHKYYYNDSIRDGYTLRLVREQIATSYHLQLQQALAELEIQQGDINKKQIYAHDKFVTPMLSYIIDDLTTSRIFHNDNTIGAMVICHSSEQAKAMYRIFNEKTQANQQNFKDKTAALILHDIDTKEDRKNNTENFKDGKLDILFVYNMLLTGFDAPRLKKLYVGRVIKDHNLLQALTRVNRPYNEFNYGYVVDFADISQEFDKTNQAYLKELAKELGEEITEYSNLFKTDAEINEIIEQINAKLCMFDINNAEIFSQQISEITDKQQILDIKQSLEAAKDLYNNLRMQQKYDCLHKLDFKKLALLYTETKKCLDRLNLNSALEQGDTSSKLLNLALEDTIFSFNKINEHELKIAADKVKEKLQKTREEMQRNIDPQDPEFIKLKDELLRLFKDGKLTAATQEAIATNDQLLERIYSEIKDLNRRNNLICTKYNNDKKYVCIHKTLIQTNPEFSQQQHKVVAALTPIKHSIDNRLLANSQLLANEAYFLGELTPIVIDEFKHQKFTLDITAVKNTAKLICNQYIKDVSCKEHEW
jgi:type I restriction enzyme R subunit